MSYEDLLALVETLGFKHEVRGWVVCVCVSISLSPLSVSVSPSLSVSLSLSPVLEADASQLLLLRRRCVLEHAS